MKTQIAHWFFETASILLICTADGCKMCLRMGKLQVHKTFSDAVFGLLLPPVVYLPYVHVGLSFGR